MVCPTPFLQRGVVRASGVALGALLMSSTITMTAGATTPPAAGEASVTAAPQPLPRRIVGVRYGSTPTETADYERWLGRNVGAVTVYLGDGNEADMLATAKAIIRKFNGSRYSLLVFSMPLVKPGSNLTATANGALDNLAREFARELVAGGRGDDVIRPGWELNGTAFAWSAVGNPTAYAAAFRRVVTVMRAVPGAQHLRFEWNIGRAGGPPPVAAYPGDAYVDIIGMDVYDRSYKAQYANPVVRWNQFMNDDSGFLWHRNFARAHGKPMAFSEWGLSSKHVSQANPDNTLFISNFVAWVKANDVVYANYFERDTNQRSRLIHYPRSAALYKTLAKQLG